MPTSTNPNPFAVTPADPSSGVNTLTTQGGNCYTFDPDYNPNPFLNHVTISEMLVKINCFDRPPIINNDVIDYPIPTPPPVTTGCYPIRARAQTVSNDGDPVGITATFTDGGDKCFPILDIELNLKPIVNDVLGIIVPGGGGGGIIIPEIPPDIGCCCDEFGGWHSPNCGSGFNGKAGTCVGYKLAGGVCCGQYQSSSCAPGGLGTRYIPAYTEEDQLDPCSAPCNPMDGGSYDCCCAAARSKFSKPQALGIGKITAGTDSEIGSPYKVEIYLSAESVGTEDGGITYTTWAYNVTETPEEFRCGDGRYIPGVAGLAQNPSYPANFSPQRICEGTIITLFAQTFASISVPDSGLFSGRNSDGERNADEAFPLNLGCLNGEDASGVNYGLETFFSMDNAHDAGCGP